MVATAPSSPSSLASPSAQGRRASKIASDGRGATEVFPENDAFGRLEHHHSDRRVATTCIGRSRPHRPNAHRARRRFSGQTRDGRYCRARYYHTDLQRFISEDPIGLAAGDVNFYVYVANNPLSFIDPLGLDRGRPRAAGLFGGAGPLGLVTPNQASCFERHRLSSVVGSVTQGTGLEGLSTVVEIVSPVAVASLTGDIIATGLKATRVGVGGPTQPYASGLNMVFRQLGRAVGSRSLTGALVAVGDVATPALAVTGAFVAGYDLTTLAQCTLGVLN